MGPIVFLVVFGGVFLAFALVILAFAKPKSRSQVESRLKRAGERDRFAGPAREPRAKTAPLRVLEERLKPFAVERLTEERESALARQLRMAGDYDTTPLRFVTRQIISALLLPVAFWLVSWGAVPLEMPVLVAGTALSILAGYRLPASRLAQKIERRQRLILRQLPTTLDLLTTCVEAGMSLQSALQKVAERMKPHPMKDELERTLKEMQLGRPRGEALRDLGRRVGLKELNSVAIALVQAETMGASVSKTLRVQSSVIREARWQAAQEQAQKAPLKMVFPITFLIFPTIFIIIFGPLILSILTGQT
ncbi:MAG: type II secretion system F family protein [Candidatus Sericytochromatia bacterium]|nr:type II secretion system F family protein [Candidatus Tanganyikabacteria bacterium]